MNDLTFPFQVGVFELSLSNPTNNPKSLPSATRRQNILAVTTMGYC
jgi:hypothetical protein